MKAGDKVTWRSQAGGSWKEKTGEIIYVVPAGRLPRSEWHQADTCLPRNHESYIVKVGRRTYWPRVSALKLAEGQSRIHHRAMAWILGSDKGISSETIWSVMMGAAMNRPCHPWDPDDFGRCYRLLKLIPEWRGRLCEVAKKHPSWAGLIEKWGDLESLYEEEISQDRAPKLYAAMKDCIKKGKE